MSWITTIWSAAAGICLTLAGVYVSVWLAELSGMRDKPFGSNRETAMNWIELL